MSTVAQTLTLRSIQLSRVVSQPPRGHGIGRSARYLEDSDDADVIVGTFFIHFVSYYTLIDIGSTHLYIASVVSANLDLTTENTIRDFFVIIPLGQSIQVDRVYRRVPLEIQEYQVSLDYATKRVTLRMNENEESDPVKLIVGDIYTVKEYSNVFLEELSGVTPDREVEFDIDLLPGTTPVSITPYYIAPKELTKLKAHL
ncbi:uncharacterized protein LOC108472187 [Gossypium arboreum]|uniref:uncharacterized protein LOC108472187 n=1 Tax=Gossypium arboreum TaxID=29729 RepID=UPI000819314A|nr:uncharacterized protein LOC108472187 [Gossypium arboreum]